MRLSNEQVIARLNNFMKWELKSVKDFTQEHFNEMVSVYDYHKGIMQDMHDDDPQVRHYLAQNEVLSRLGSHILENFQDINKTEIVYNLTLQAFGYDYLRHDDLRANFDLFQIGHMPEGSRSFWFALPEEKKEPFLDMIKDKRYNLITTYRELSPLSDWWGK